MATASRIATIEHSIDAGTNWVVAGSTTATYFVAGGLTCLTEYTFRVIAVNEDGNSNPSDTEAITTGECPIELLVNTSFETDTDGDKIPDNWPGTTLTGDKQKCNKDTDGDGTPDKIVAHTGNCAFAFKGSVGENSVIEQTVVDVSAVTVADSFQISMWVSGKNADKGAVYKLKFNYANGAKDSLKLSSGVGTFDFTNYTSGILQLPDAVTSVSATIKYKGAAGKVTVDDVSLSLTELGVPVPEWVWDLVKQGNVYAPATSGGLIPLPPAQ
jgi:hypothetical protein